MSHRAQPEAQLQRAVIQHLRLRRRARWTYWATPNAAKRSPREGRDLKAQGMVPGVGDISLLSPDGSYYELELKTGTGKLSDAQKARAIEVEASCGTWAVAHGIDEALATLTAWGALR
jgi:hypothetical protein